MRALLFRRIVVDGVNYYQLYETDNDFKVEPMFGDYSNRSTSDFFYIDRDSDIEVPDESLLNIYCDDDSKKGGLKVVSDFELYGKVSREFNEVFRYFDNEVKIDNMIDNICDKVLYQEATVMSLIERIFVNQDIVNSDLPVELKMKQKHNILLCGKVGTGKKSLINALEEELDIPYADIEIGPDIKDTLEEVIKKLLDKAKSAKDASRGIVFIRDNYNDLIELLDDKFYGYMDFLTSQEEVGYKGKTIDFRTVTFVVLLNQNNLTNEDIQTFAELANCTCRIKTRDLTTVDKYMILYSPNGRLKQYEKFLNSKGRKLHVNSKSLVKLIELCAKIDRNMLALNSMIDNIMKLYLSKGICDVYIDDDTIASVLPLLENSEEDKKSHVSHTNNKEEFWFEKREEEIINEAKKDVVGQDKAVKMIVHQLLKNINWANKKDVDNPKQYIKNILIRGNTGTGKTFISSTILKLLDVPYFVADATEYTEAGYVGKDVEEMLVGLYHAAGDDLAKAQRGILVIDEVDKRATHVGAGHDVSGSGVQEALYKLAEGTKIRINVGTRLQENFIYFDTSRLTIICSGAFEGIESFRDERIGKKKVGFGNQEVSPEEAAIIDDDYVSYGMKSQFMRRVKQIIELKDVSKEQFVDIMKKSRSSALKVEKETYEDQGIEIEYTDDFYDALADKALSMKQGVTGIEKALLKVFQNINIQDIKPSRVKKIVFNGDVVNNPNKVILEEREKVKTKKI